MSNGSVDDEATADGPDREQDGSAGQTVDDGEPIVDVGEFIREQRQLAEMSLRRLAELADVSNPYLSQVERGLRKPSAQILQQLARALQISAETMYVRAGMLDSETVRQPSLESAIRHAVDLTEEQRKALLSVYRSFLAANGTDKADSPPSETGADTPPSETGADTEAAETGTDP